MQCQTFRYSKLQDTASIFSIKAGEKPEGKKLQLLFWDLDLKKPQVI